MSMSIEVRPIIVRAEGRAIHEQVLVPAASGRSPHTDGTMEACLPWLDEMGLLERVPARVYRQGRFHELMGNIYLEEDAEALAICAQFACLLFATDDLFDDLQGLPWRTHSARAHAAIADIKAGARSFTAPRSDRRPLACIARAYADLIPRILASTPEHAPLLAALDDYLDGTAAEVAYRQRGGFESLAVYDRERARFSAVDLAVEVGLALRGVRRSALPENWASLLWSTNMHVSYINDMASLAKERANGEISNIVTVIEAAEGVGLEEAVHRACRRTDRHTLRYAALRQQTSTATALLESWMRGSHTWHTGQTARYSEGLSVAPTGGEGLAHAS